MKAVYCEWPECKHYKEEKDFVWGAGECTKEAIRMYRGRLKYTIKDPPTCSWYQEREKEKASE